MKRSALGFLFLMLAACGDSSDPPGDTATLHNGNGGSGGAQEPAPAPRANHVAVFDEGNDRMIVFDGSNSEVWQLPLSGPSANVWAPLIVKGVQPPSHDIKSFFYADSAVFDPIGQRMLVLLNASPATGKVDNTVRLWSLSLNGEPQWTKIAADGPSPGVEIQSARMAYDREGQRVFFLGGALQNAALWSLSLAATPTWSRLADAPDKEKFYTGHVMLFDAKRKNILLSNAYPRDGRLWSFSLEESQWTLLNEGTFESQGYGASAAIDPVGDRIVLRGGDHEGAVALFSLNKHAWSESSLPAGLPGQVGPSVVYDTKRSRLIYFGGADLSEIPVSNETWTLDLAGLSWSKLKAGSASNSSQ